MLFQNKVIKPSRLSLSKSIHHNEAWNEEFVFYDFDDWDDREIDVEEVSGDISDNADDINDDTTDTTLMGHH